HRMRGEGGVLGPDLTEVHKRWKGKRIDVLREILEPSRVVEEKYRAHDITTVLGERLYGLISERGKKHLMIVTNPQNPVPQKIALKDIDTQTTTSQSLMPMGILNTFSRNQILDLMAYMESGGDPKHGLFKE
ncbi:MAG: hypothetical protein QGF59_11885, partial [Pirellulaceae bacterium]|nr:hypothetical protein [Pirellulaceae bacterium]